MAAIFRYTFIKLSPKTFNKQNFFHEVDQKLTIGDTFKTDDSHCKFTEFFSEVSEKHVPSK